MLKGKRTFIAQIIGLGATIGTMYGLDIAPEAQTEITTGIVSAWAVINLIIRRVTNTPMFKSE